MDFTEKQITEDMHLLCAQAASFPAGIMAAFQKIEKADPEFCRRKFYGLSRGKSDGGIEYWAAVDMDDRAEPQRTGLDSKTVQKGTYAAILVNDFRTNTAAIGNAFRTLLNNPRLDRNSWCVEVYHGEDVECMVRLNDR